MTVTDPTRERIFTRGTCDGGETILLANQVVAFAATKWRGKNGGVEIKKNRKTRKGGA